MAVASVNNVYQLVMRRAAKEEEGFISPSDFNAYARNEQQKVFQETLAQYRLYKANKQRYLTYWKENYKSLEAIQDDLITLRRNGVALSSSGGNNVFQFPSDYAYYIDIEYNSEPVTLIDYADKNYYVGSYDSAATEAHPVAYKDYNSITFLPSTITSDTKISYYKIPQGVNASGTPVSNQPTWAYSTVASKSIYDATNSIDFELPAHLEYRLATGILMSAGIELRDGELYQMAQAEEQKERQDKNS